MLQIAIYVPIFFLFLHRAQKISFYTKTLVDGHKMFRYIPEIFCSNYLNFLK
jgi:hypothetical protein